MLSAIERREDPTVEAVAHFWRGQPNDLALVGGVEQQPGKPRDPLHLRFWRTVYVTADGRRVFVGTAAAFLAVNLGLGLGATTLPMVAVLIAAMFWQIRQRSYVPAVCWTAVVLISIVGTLITDNMTDAFGIPLLHSSIGFTLALAATFALWRASERTLSIHEVFTFRREAFYWLAILFTFALGASFGDFLAQSADDGGLGLGTVITSIAFLAVIAGTVRAMTTRLAPELAE